MEKSLIHVLFMNTKSSECLCLHLNILCLIFLIWAAYQYSLILFSKQLSKLSSSKILDLTSNYIEWLQRKPFNLEKTTTWLSLSHQELRSLLFCYRSQLINFIKKYFKELAYIYYDKCFKWRNLCWVLKKKQPNIGLATFKIF